MQHGIQFLRRGLIPLLILVLCLAACGGEPAETEKSGKDKTKAATEATAAGPSAAAETTNTVTEPVEVTEPAKVTEPVTDPPTAAPTDPPTEASTAEPRTVSAEELPDYATNCYTMQTFYDSRYGLKTVQVLVPYGWNVEVNVEWGVISTLYPATATVIMSAPDGSAAIEICSPQTFVQMSRNGVAVQEGVNYGMYNTFINYKNAHDYNLYIASSVLGYYGASVISATGATAEAQKVLDEAAYNYLLSFMGSQTQALGCEGTAEKTCFKVGQGGVDRIAVMSAVIGAESAITAGAYFDQIFWTVPYTAVFYAASEAAWNTYGPVFDHVVNNTCFCSEFIFVVRKNGKYIADMINNYLLEQAYNPTSSDISNWDSEYVDEGKDTFLNEWSDVIYERNEYLTEDGSSIKVDTKYDTVYQNEDLIYMGPDGLAPDGWTRLQQK
jgi:hypothetical protein